MNCFLIDFENVNSGGMKGIEHLTENDDVYIFYSDHANSITFDIHHKMNKSTANIHFFKSEIIGKNSLDFQIVSYMGYLVAQKKYQNYFLVSIDRGFDYAVKFWKNYFKQNKIYDLEINRYYSIQDGLNKKSTGSDNRQSNRKVPPTIPTVESEIELQQIKAENVIIDRTSPTIEKHIEKNLNNPTNVKPKSSSTTIKTTSKTTTKSYNKNHSTTVQQPTNANKSAFVNKDTTTPTDTPKPINTTQNDTPIQIKDTLVGSNPNAKRLDNIETISDTTTPTSDSKELNKYPKNPNNNNNNNRNNNNNNNNNNRKLFNQKKTNNGNNNNNNKKNGNAPQGGNKNAPNSRPINKPDTQKSVFTEQYKQPEETVTANKSTTEIAQPKSFTFGKINLDDGSVVTETLKNRSVLTKPTETPKETVKPSIDNKPKDTTPKKEDTPNGSSVKPSEEKPTATPEKVDTKPKNTPKAKPKKESSKATAKDAPKRKVGRPRTRPVQDESKKPKNNKSFEQEIPNDRLTTMLEKVAQIDHLNGYSYDDKVKICKVIVFSDTKQNCYRAFMSCFGKLKGVEIYGAVKPIFQAIRDLYTVPQAVPQN